MKLLGYNRVSTEDQAKYGHSLDIQPERHARWCEAMGHELVDIITDDGVSAGKPFETRKGGQQLMRMLEEGVADGMLITRFDRAFRVTLDGIQSANWFKANFYSVLSVEQPIDITTPFGWKMFINMVADAEYERAMTIERTRETIQGMRRQGKVYGAVPFGLIKIDGRLYRHPDDWDTRQTIIDMSHVPGYGPRKIAGWLQAMNIPAPGGKGKGGKSVGGRLWHASTVSRIIKTHSDLEHIPALPDLPESSVSH
jgi:site-specific DNA recombinase